MAIMKKETKIRREKERLEAIYSDLDEKRKELAYRLCDKAAFLAVSIEECQEDISKNGYYEKFQQTKGLDPYERARPVVNSFISFTSSYQKYMKQLSDMIPERKEEGPDGFDEFIGGRDD